uniref:RING-type E3 ubiquitin transferase n=1 Tax=Anser brachyrhynchus TaxID=132585 RepID=A0A8B9C2W5_9AVES
MATALDKRCPICLDTWSDAGYVLPCLHQFCFECIQRWAERKPKCPLCKGRALVTINHGRRAPGGPATHSPPRPVTSRLLTVGLASNAPLSGIHPLLAALGCARLWWGYSSCCPALNKHTYFTISLIVEFAFCTSVKKRSAWLNADLTLALFFFFFLHTFNFPLY